MPFYFVKKIPEFSFYQSEMTKIPKLNMKFDMICMFSVLTHMLPNEIINLLKELKPYLKINGCIVISMIINPNLSTFSGIRDKVEMNEQYFFNLIQKSGFTKIEKFDHTMKGQIRYKIM